MPLHYISLIFCYVRTLLLSSPSLFFSITSLSLSPSYQHVLRLYFLVSACVAWFPSFPFSPPLSSLLHLSLLLPSLFLFFSFFFLLFSFNHHFSSAHFTLFTSPPIISQSLLLLSFCLSLSTPFLLTSCSFPFLPPAVIAPFAVFISSSLFFPLHLSRMDCWFQKAWRQQLDRAERNKLWTRSDPLLAGDSWAYNNKTEVNDIWLRALLFLNVGRLLVLFLIWLTSKFDRSFWVWCWMQVFFLHH